MRTAAALKLEIEAKLAERIPGALSPLAPQAPRLHSTGVAAVDALLHGGLPLGSVCELTGPASSGRTSLALALLAEASMTGACAYLDVGDSFHPHGAAAAGVRLRNLLWVRFADAAGGEQQTAARGAEDRIGKALVPAPVPAGKYPPRTGGGGAHPRTETRGMAPALEDMLLARAERRQRRMEGTPGYPNQPIGLGAASEEQVAWERFNSRKPDEGDPLRQANQRAAAAARAGLLSVDTAGPERRDGVTAGSGPRALAPWPEASRRAGPRDGEGGAIRHEIEHQRRPLTRPWGRLDAALRATDQVLQAGGFRVVVLDLASLRAEEALRVPSATWWRYRRAVQGGDALLVLLTPEPCARSGAACVLQCAGEPAGDAGRHVLAGWTFQAEVARQRTGAVWGKKSPGRVADWQAAPTWMRAAGR